MTASPRDAMRELGKICAITGPTFVCRTRRWRYLIAGRKPARSIAGCVALGFAYHNRDRDKVVHKAPLSVSSGDP